MYYKATYIALLLGVEWSNKEVFMDKTAGQFSKNCGIFRDPFAGRNVVGVC